MGEAGKVETDGEMDTAGWTLAPKSVLVCGVVEYVWRGGDAGWIAKEPGQRTKGRRRSPKQCRDGMRVRDACG